MRSILGAAAMMVTAAAVAGAQVAAVTSADAPMKGSAAAWDLLPESRLWVDGTSTVQSYTCEAERLDVRISGSPATVVTAVSELQMAVRGLDLSVPVGSLECGNGTMNGHMRNALRAEDNPAISFRLTSHEVMADADAMGRVRLAGKLTIAGETRPITMEVEAWLESATRIRVMGTTELKMTDFGVRPPRLMLGTLRVHDPVKVYFDLVINPPTSGS